MQHLSQEHDTGGIDVVVPVDKFQGAYRTMAQGVNTMVGGRIAVKKKAMAAKDFTRPIDGEYAGDFAILKNNVNAVVENVRDAVNQILGHACPVCSVWYL